MNRTRMALEVGNRGMSIGGWTGGRSGLPVVPTNESAGVRADDDENVCAAVGENPDVPTDEGAWVGTYTDEEPACVGKYADDPARVSASFSSHGRYSSMDLALLCADAPEMARTHF